MRNERHRPLGFEKKTILLGAATTLPAFVTLFTVLLANQISWQSRSAIVGGVLVATLIALSVLHDHIIYPLRTLSNILAALREEDYSIRGCGARGDDALGEVMIEVNELSKLLRERRLGAIEASALLRTVISEIDAAIFAFDAQLRLRLVNRAGERLMAAPAERLLGREATELGLRRCLDAEDLTALEISFPGGRGRWGIRKSAFRESGHQHALLLVTDLSQALRDEERQAWQRLVRVLSHELNNSLAPIKSIATSLLSNASRDPLPADWNDDMQRGLTVIASRAESLTRFMDAYSRLARLPRPRFGRVAIGELLQRIALLERRLEIEVQPGPPITIQADADQMEQVVINLVRNAVDAAIETGGGVSMSWSAPARHVEIVVADEGRGLGGSANLFVPFYTTKPGGTGIGLVLSRQIADAHGGTLTLENRADRSGCIARLRIPVQQTLVESC
jgi:two-component system nitrogen regulation sensor histidine kinase NtrY